MKDAKGHGSDARAAGAFVRRVSGEGARNSPSGRPLMAQLAPEARFPSQANAMRPDRDYTSDTARTVFGLRQRMQATGPGHRTGLMQGIKNLLGG